MTVHGANCTVNTVHSTYLIGEVENSAVAIAADVAVALCAEGGATDVAAKGPPADGASHEVSCPHSVRPSRQSTTVHERTHKRGKRQQQTITSVITVMHEEDNR